MVTSVRSDPAARTPMRRRLEIFRRAESYCLMEAGAGAGVSRVLQIEDPTEVGKCIFINVNNRTGYSNFKER